MARRNGNNGDNTLNGTRQRDVIKGFGGDDTINGRKGADRIYAGSGNDTIIAGTGDRIFGGSGTDTARFNFNFDPDLLIKTDSGWIITPPGGGAIRLASVEVFEFADMTLTEVELTAWAENTNPAFGAAPSFDIAETATPGASLGAVTATDADGDTLTYSLSGDGADLFEIDSATGEITIATGASFDFETRDTYHLVVTANDPYGGEAEQEVTVNVTDVNEGPVVTRVETSIADGSADDNRVTTTAEVYDPEENWDGGEIRLTPPTLLFFGDALLSGDGATIVGGVGTSGNYSYSLSGSDIIATPTAGGPGFTVGTLGETGIVLGLIDAFTEVSITLTAQATNEIVTDLLHQIRVDGIINALGGAASGEITVTIEDGDGETTSFTREMNSDDPSTIENLDGDDRAVDHATLSAGVTLDVGGDADFVNDGFDLDGAIFSVVSTAVNSEIDVTGGGTDYHVVGGVFYRDDGDDLPDAGDVQIGTISGNGTDDVSVTLGSAATNADIDALLQAISYASAQVGVHHVTVSLTDGASDDEISADVTLTTGVTMAQLASASAATPIVIAGAMSIEVTSDETFDVAQAIADGKIVIDGTPVITLEFDAARDLSGIENLHDLGDVNLNGLNGFTATISGAQVAGFGYHDVDGSLVLADLGANAAVDLSRLDASGTLTATLSSDLTFTGDLGDFEVTVTAGHILAGAASLLGDPGAGHSIVGAGDVRILGLDGSAAFDFTNIAVTGTALARISGNPVLHSGTDLGGLSLQVVRNGAMGLTAAQADGRDISGHSRGTESVVVDLTGQGGVFDLTGIGGGVEGVFLYSPGDFDLTGADLGSLFRTVWVNDEDNDTDQLYTITLTAGQAHQMARNGGGVLNLGADGEDSVRMVTTEVAIADGADAGTSADDERGVRYSGTVFNDDLSGSNARDVINGGRGNDMINGGSGKDYLTGGRGLDTFVFNAAGTDTGRDVIRDFKGGSKPWGDVIGIDFDGNASFIGRGGFTAGGDAEVRYVKFKKMAVVHVDVDGDGAGDFSIQLNGVTALGADDFVFDL